MISSLLRRLGRPTTPTRVAVDLTRLSRGGQNGGIKVAIYGFLQWIAEARGEEFVFIYLTNSSLVSEVEAFRRDLDWQVCVGESEGTPMPSRDGGRQGLVPAQGVTDWTQHWPADVLYAPLGFSPFCRPGLPWVSLLVDTLHRDLPQMLPPEEVEFRDRYFREAIAHADAVQCISRFVKGQLERYFAAPADKLFVTHVAIQDRILATTPPLSGGSPTGRPYFLYPANDWPHKNHARLLQAYSDYRRASGGAWDLILSGHFAQEKMWRERINELGLAESCRLLGHMEPEEFAAGFRNAGALVFPSLYEGFGIPILEAMALGIPVACSRAGSIPEVAGDAGLFFDPEQTGDIANALHKISEYPKLREKLVEAGRKRALEFSLAKEAGRLADRFADLGRRKK